MSFIAAFSVENAKPGWILQEPGASSSRDDLVVVGKVVDDDGVVTLMVQQRRTGRTYSKEYRVKDIEYRLCE